MKSVSGTDCMKKFILRQSVPIRGLLFVAGTIG